MSTAQLPHADQSVRSRQIMLHRGEDNDWFSSSMIKQFGLLAAVAGRDRLATVGREPPVDLRCLKDRSSVSAWSWCRVLGRSRWRMAADASSVHGRPSDAVRPFLPGNQLAAHMPALQAIVRTAHDAHASARGPINRTLDRQAAILS